MKQSALVAALILREIEGGRFYILTRDCRLMDWSRGGGEESQTKYTFDLFFSHIGHRKTKTNPSQGRKSHLSVCPSICSSTPPPVFPHLLPSWNISIPDCKQRLFQQHEGGVLRVRCSQPIRSLLYRRRIWKM